MNRFYFYSTQHISICKQIWTRPWLFLEEKDSLSVFTRTLHKPAGRTVLKFCFIISWVGGSETKQEEGAERGREREKADSNLLLRRALPNFVTGDQDALRVNRCTPLFSHRSRKRVFVYPSLISCCYPVCISPPKTLWLSTPIPTDSALRLFKKNLRQRVFLTCNICYLSVCRDIKTKVCDHDILPFKNFKETTYSFCTVSVYFRLTF